MNLKSYKNIEAYNDFCSHLKEGYILYNIDTTNQWGDYLLVANIATVNIGDTKTYTVMLLGLRKREKDLVPRNLRIKLTPDYAANTPFLKYVGRCNYNILPTIWNLDFNLGLATIYGTVDLHKYREKINIKKPRKRKYGKDGKPIIKQTKNES